MGIETSGNSRGMADGDTRELRSWDWKNKNYRHSIYLKVPWTTHPVLAYDLLEHENGRIVHKTSDSRRIT
ncbi:MAG: hypothetical protein JRI56_00065 [Deltaproteobacteria bacterium]|nr:hypothetical protein [Deltaproteobacteria bacterium]